MLNYTKYYYKIKINKKIKNDYILIIIYLFIIKNK